VFVSTIESQQETQGDEWAYRSSYWLESVRKHTPKRKRRERQANPLILTGHGISLNVEKGTLLISDGHTYHPAEKTVWRFFRGDLTLPKRIVLVDGSGHITLDALDWLAEQGISLIRLKWDGQPISAIAASGSLIDLKKLAWQISAQSDELARMKLAVPLIRAKAKATLVNLRELLPPSHSREKAIDTAITAIRDLTKSPPNSIGELLAIEGWVAAGYFFAWRALPINWKSQNRYPIHDEWRQFFSRSSLSAEIKKRNGGATHPVNAMLNYAYSLLEAHVRIGVITDGYDPARGILHSGVAPDRQSFVFDMMEPLRAVVDRAVLKLIKEETFSGADFILQQDGVCRLSPELARRVIHQANLQLRSAV